MKNHARRFLAGLLSAAMVFGSVPSSAYADTVGIVTQSEPETETEAPAAKLQGGVEALPAGIDAEGSLAVLAGAYTVKAEAEAGAVALDAEGLSLEKSEDAPEAAELKDHLYYVQKDALAEGRCAADAKKAVTDFALEMLEDGTVVMRAFSDGQELDLTDGVLLLAVQELAAPEEGQTETAAETEAAADTETPTEAATEAPAETELQDELATEAVAENVTETSAETEAQTEAVTEALAETEAQTEAVTEVPAETEAQTEAVTEVPAETEAQTEAVTEAITEAPAEAETEAATEAVTEAPTGAQTEAVTETVTEAPAETEAQTEAPTEAVTEVPTEAETEVVTEAVTEAPTEAETEVVTEAVTEAPTEAETEVVTEAVTEAPAETEAPTEAVTEAPAETEAPTEAMTEAPAETELQTEEMTEIESESETGEVVEEEGISEEKVFEMPTDDGKVVKLSAPEGAFPVPASEVTMTVDPLTEEQKAALEEQLTAMAEADGMKVTEYVAYDINLWVNGEIIQPLLPVQVTFENVAVAQESEDIPEDMSAVETAGFQMDADTMELSDVNDTTVADDATPEEATVAVEVEHFTITGGVFTQVDPTNPNNYVFTLARSGDGTQEDGKTEEDGASSGEVVTFEVKVESLKGIDENELTLVPSVVDGTEEAGESAAEGEAQGTPVEVTFQADGEDLENEIKNPEALGENESWTQTIQIPVSELEGVANPMLNLALRSGGNEIATINSGIMLMAMETYSAQMPTMGSSSNSYTPSAEPFDNFKKIDYLDDGVKNPDTGLTGKDYYRLYLDMTGRAEPMDLLIVVDESSSMVSNALSGKTRINAVRDMLNGNNGLIKTFLNTHPQNKLALIGFSGGSQIRAYASGNLDSRVYGDVNYSYSTDAKLHQNWITHTSNYQYSYNIPGTASTNYVAALYKAADVFNDSSVKNDGHKHVMIFISDGNPTCYLEADSGHKNGYRRQGNNLDDGDNGPYVTECKAPTNNASTLFKNNFKDVTIYTVGIDTKPQTLINIASDANKAYKISNSGDLINKMWQIVFPTAVSIVDTLSTYVDYYSAQPDLELTMTDTSGKTTVLWDRNGKRNAGKGIIDSVTYDPATRRVTAKFSEEYPMREGYKYTLSFNVELSKAAKDYYLKNGTYPNTGDPDTDYTGNKTSSGKAGFFSNDNSKTYVEYESPAYPKGNKEEYPKPVVQTGDPRKEETAPGADKQLSVGDEITYTIEWHNYKGNRARITITDTLHEGLDFVSAANGGTCDDGRTIVWSFTAKAGTTGKVSFVVRVNEKALVTDEVTNTATVKVATDSEITTNTIENPVPKKEEVTPGDRVCVKVGDEITYRIYWRNTYDTRETVTITDALDPGLDFVRYGETIGLDGSRYTGQVKKDPPGNELQWTFTAYPNTYGYVSFVARVNKNALTDPDRIVENTATVKIKNDSKQTNKVENPVIEKRESDPGDGKLVQVGDIITYKIDWQNAHDDSRTVVIKDELDPGVSFDSADNGGVYDEGGHVVTWTLEKQPPRSHGTVSFKVKVEANALEDDSKVVNDAHVQVEHDPDVWTNEVENPLPKKEETDPGDRLSVKVGQEITYKIYWENAYDEEKTVTITDKLDKGLDFVSAENGGTHDEATHTVTWNLGTQAPNTKGSVTFVAKVNKNALEDNLVENDADVQIGDDPAVKTNKVENPVPEKEEVPDPDGDNIADGDLVQIGNTIKYRIYWKNAHDDKRTVTVTDKIDPGLTVDETTISDGGSYDGTTRTITWTLGEQDPGSEGWVTFKATVNENARDAMEGGDSKVINNAKVKVGGDPDVTTQPVENPVPEKTETDPGVDWGVKPGQQITYEITWENSYDTEAKVVITDGLDKGLNYVKAVGDHAEQAVYDENKHTVTWTFNAAAGTKGKVSFTAEVNRDAFEKHMVKNKASVQVGNKPAVETNVVENPVPEKKETDPGADAPVEAGDVITYEVHWYNTHDTAANVTVTDRLDPGVEFVEGSAEYSYGEITGSDSYVYSDHTLTWTIKDVPANTAGRVSFKVTVTEAALDHGQTGEPDGSIFTPGDGKVRNQASVQVGQDPAVDTDIIDNPVPEKQEVNPGDRQSVEVGNEITYEIFWENTHDTEAEVVITDALDEGLDFVSAENGGTYDEAARTVTWNLGRQAANTAGSVKFTARVNEKALDNDNKVENKATVEVDHQSAVTNKVENPVPEKRETPLGDTDDGEMAQIGDTIAYEIDWENAHDEAADVIVTDALDPGVDYVEGSAVFSYKSRTGAFVSATTGSGQYDRAAHTVTWTIKGVPARTKGTVSFQVLVTARALDKNKAENQAKVKVGHDPEVNTNTVQNPVPEKRETDPGADKLVKEGDQITYEIDWENGHDEPAAVVVKDRLDPGVKYVPDTARFSYTLKESGRFSMGAEGDGVYDADTHTIIWTMENVPAHTKGIVRFTVEVTAAAIDHGQTGEPDGIFTPGDGKVRNQASVQVGNDREVWTEIIDNPVPEKQEVTPGDGQSVEIGSEITYEIFWENTSEEQQIISITDVLDEGLDFVEASHGGMLTEGTDRETGRTTRTILWRRVAQPNTSGSVTFTARVNEKAIENDYTVENQAKVQLGHDPAVDTNKVENPVPEKHEEQNQEGDPDDRDLVQVGDTINYAISWKNSYDDARDVTIVDELDEGLTFVEGSADNGGVYDAETHTLTWLLEEQAPGAAGAVHFSAVVNEKALDAVQGGDDKVFNDAFVQVGDEPGITTKPVENPIPEKTETDPGEDIGVYPGRQISYEVYWENAYDEEAAVTITDPLDAGVKFVEVTGSHAEDAVYSEADHTIVWTFQAPAHDKGKVSFTVEVLESAVDYVPGTTEEGAGDGKVVNRAQVQVGNSSRWTNDIENPTTEPHKTEPNPGNLEGVVVGDTIDYVVTWENYEPEAATVTVRDRLDPGVDYVEGSAVSTAGAAGVYDAASRTITWTMENVPARGEEGYSGTVSFSVTVNESALDFGEAGEADGIFTPGDGKVLNQANVQVNNDPAVDTEIVENPVTKTGKDATAVEPAEGSTEIAPVPNADGTFNDTVVQVGDILTYTIAWENYSDEAAKVVIRDALEEGLTYVAGSAAVQTADGTELSAAGITAEISDADNTVVWTLQNVPKRGDPGYKGTVTFRAEVNENARIADRVENEATTQVVGNGFDRELTTEPVENPVPEKTEPDPGNLIGVEPGSKITYEIGWENTYDRQAAVVITDPLDAGVSFVEAKGEHMADAVYNAETHTVVWTFTAEPETRGTVSFVVEVLQSAADYETGGDGKVLNRALVQVDNNSRWTNEVENPVTDPHKTEPDPGDRAGVLAGDTIDYVVTWENYKTEAATVTVRDTLDPGVDYVEGTAVSSTGAAGVYDAASRTLTWTMENVPARGTDGSSGTVSFSVTVNESAVDYVAGTEDGQPGDGKVLNQARVQVDDHPELYTEIVENPVTEPEKTEPDPGEDLPVELGDTVTYDVFWENYTDETATVVVRDPLDIGLTYVEGSASDGGVYNAETRTIVWTIQNVPARGTEGSTGHVEFSATVNEAARVTGIVENQAGVQVGNYPELLTNIVENPMEPLMVTKIDAETGEQLEGAVLRIVDAQGRLVEEWTTNGTPHAVKAKLAAGATYTLIEVSAPTYYGIAQSVSFTVGEDGSADPIVMEDRRIRSDDATIAVTKTLMYGGAPVNAVDETFYVALFEDEERTTRVSDIKAIEFRNASASTVEFSGLELGKMYYIGETDVNGIMIASGELEDGTLYRADFNEGYEAVVREEDGTVTRNFRNYLERIPGDRFYYEGELTVTKQLYDMDGNPATGSNQTFYAGVFEDAGYTTLSDRVETNIIPLPLNGGSSVSKTVPVSIAPDETLTLYVTEVDENGTPVSQIPTFMYNVTLDRMNVTMSREDNEASVTITNRPPTSSGFYEESYLRITKELLGADGAAKESDKTFYAGIFADAAHTELAGNVSANIVELALAGGSSVTQEVGVTVLEGETVTLYVTEVDADGVPVENSASFEYDVTVDGAEVSLNRGDTAETTITNAERAETQEETELNEDSGQEGSQSSDDPSEIVPAGSGSVKTGDDTPLGLYIGLMAAAILLMAVVLVFRRRRRSQGR